MNESNEKMKESLGNEQYENKERKEERKIKREGSASLDSISIKKDRMLHATLILLQQLPPSFDVLIYDFTIS